MLWWNEKSVSNGDNNYYLKKVSQAVFKPRYPWNWTNSLLDKILTPAGCS